MRFLFAAPFLLLLAALTQTPLCFPPGQRGFQVVVSLFYFAIPFTLMIYGERYVSPALASLLFAAMPVAVMAASALILQDRISRRQTAGLILATAALALILLNEAKTAVQGHWRGIAALAVAVIMHAILYAQCKKRSARLPVLTFNALPCLAAGGLLLLAGSLLESPAPTTFAFRSVMATLYLGAVAGVFGILCYFALQQRAGPFRASLAFLVFPVIAVGLDAWLANTPSLQPVCC
ncbi:DMT family transporter [Klebsiella michiganensis]|uniref:DMT family transporter n=1 Tax=Klebsiella michiganensis TaxID=1134687 RepID=UPI0032F0470B